MRARAGRLGRLARRKPRDSIISVVLSSYPAMRPLSATECISPALQRTRDVLWRPFRLGTFLKLAAVAFFAELGGGFNFNLPGRGGNLHGVAPAVQAFLVAFAVILGLGALIVGLALLYIGSRLQLVLIELVATRQRYVAPLWRKYGSPTWRWIGFKVLFFLLSVLLCLVLAVPLILYFVGHHLGFGTIFSGSLFSALHLTQIILFIALALLILLIVSVAYALVRDLGLPFLALEDLTLSDTLGRLQALLATEPGEVALFLLLRLVLGIAFGIVAELAVVIILVISLLPVAIVGVILWAALHNAGPGGTAALIGCAIFCGLIFISWAMCVMIAILGSLLTFNQAYALYFLGGRYPMLGDLLDRSTPPPTNPYAASFPSYPPPYYPPQTGPPVAPPGPSGGV
jgi:hypothetical protein